MGEQATIFASMPKHQNMQLLLALKTTAKWTSDKAKSSLRRPLQRQPHQCIQCRTVAQFFQRQRHRTLRLAGFEAEAGERRDGIGDIAVPRLGRCRQFAKTISNKDGGGDFVLKKIACIRYNYGDSGADVLPFTQGVVTDLDIAYVGNGVVAASGEYADVEAKGAGAGLGLGTQNPELRTQN